MNILKEIAISCDININGKAVNPRYAYTSRSDWYDHLLTLNHKGITGAINHLRNDVEPGKRRAMSDYLESKLLSKLESIQDNKELN